MFLKSCFKYFTGVTGVVSALLKPIYSLVLCADTVKYFARLHSRGYEATFSVLANRSFTECGTWTLCVSERNVE